MATAKITRKPAIRYRAGCNCPLCFPAIDMDGVYFCREGREFIAVHEDVIVAVKPTELAATEQLNAYRYDLLTKPIEAAAAEADTEAEIAEFVAEVAQADEARKAALTAAQDRTVDAYLDAVLSGKTDEATALLAELEATPGLTEQNLNFIRYVKPGPAQEPITLINLFPIYYSPDGNGLTWSGAPECYTNWIDAAAARDAQLAELA